MAFLDKIENIIRSAYFEIVKKQSLISKQGRELNCGSFAYIAKEIKLILVECNKNGLNVLETANQLIHGVLKKIFLYMIIM
jgi:hypothetical protein